VAWAATRILPVHRSHPYVLEMTNGAVAASGDAEDCSVNWRRMRRNRSALATSVSQPHWLRPRVAPMDVLPSAAHSQRVRTMKRFLSTNDHVLPRPLERLPEYARTNARRTLADRLVAAFGMSEPAADATSNAVVDPSAVRKAIGEPSDP
jgi:hypothetical protein